MSREFAAGDRYTLPSGQVVVVQVRLIPFGEDVPDAADRHYVYELGLDGSIYRVQITEQPRPGGIPAFEPTALKVDDLVGPK